MDRVITRSSNGAGQWTPVRASTVPSKIVGQVRDALFEGRLKPGDFLGSEQDLAREFGVSRVTVRDAMRTLEATGIVEIRVGVGGGARIAQGDPGRFADALAVQFRLVGIHAEEMFEAQLAIEAAAVEIAAKKATQRDLTHLEELLDHAATLIDEPDAFTRTTFRFHLGLVEASHNRALIAQMQALMQVLYATYVARTTREVAQRVLRRHRKTLNMVRQGKGLEARQAITDHLTNVRTSVMSGIREADASAAAPRGATATRL